MDEQHRQFLEALNRLYTAILERKNPELLRDAVALLPEYAIPHFSAGERILQETGYEGIQAHRAQHDFFSAQVSEPKNTCERAGEKSPESVLQFMRNWFLHHILEVDRGSMQNLKGPREVQLEEG